MLDYTGDCREPLGSPGGSIGTQNPLKSAPAQISILDGGTLYRLPVTFSTTKKDFMLNMFHQMYGFIPLIWAL